LKISKLHIPKLGTELSGPIKILQVRLYEFSQKFFCLYISRVLATHSLLLAKIYVDPTKSCETLFQSGEAHDF